MSTKQAFPTNDGAIKDMTLRDYFAAKAMQALMTANVPVYHDDFDVVARQAYKQADSMLKAREKQS